MQCYVCKKDIDSEVRLYVVSEGAAKILHLHEECLDKIPVFACRKKIIGNEAQIGKLSKNFCSLMYTVVRCRETSIMFGILSMAPLLK